MPVQETPSTKALIDRYYQEERDQQLRDQTLADMTLKIESNDLALLTILSKRFSKSREEVLKDLTSSALADLFTAIDANERKVLARDADEQARSIADAIAEDNGLPEIGSKPNHWAQLDKTIVRLEKKKVKEAAEAARLQSTTTGSSLESETAPNVEQANSTTEVVEADQQSEAVTETVSEEVASTEAAPGMSVFSE